MQEKVYWKRGVSVIGYGILIFSLIIVCISIEIEDKTPLYVIVGIVVAVLASKATSLLQEKLILGQHSVIVKKWWIMKTSEEVRYEKINNIKLSSFETLEIITGNDHPVRFRWLDKCWEVKKLLDQKITIKGGNAETVIADSSDSLDKIAKLSQLYKEGILTEEEFTSKKKELLKNAN